jgi:hypothetical protein
MYCFKLGLDYQRFTKSDLLLVLHLGVETCYLGDLFNENSNLGMAFEETSLASNIQGRKHSKGCYTCLSHACYFIH